MRYPIPLLSCINFLYLGHACFPLHILQSLGAKKLAHYIKDMQKMEEIKTFIENLLDTHEIRVKVISKAMRATVDHLKDLSGRQAKMALELRDSLARKQSLRKKDFDSFLQDIVLQNLDKEKEITRAIEDLEKEEGAMSASLRRILAGKEQITLGEFKLTSKEIIERLTEREKKASDMLRQFHIRQGEVSEGLSRLLDKGEDIKVKDFKVMTDAIKIKYQERDSDVGRMLDDLEEVQQGINLQWQELRKSYLK